MDRFENDFFEREPNSETPSLGIIYVGLHENASGDDVILGLIISLINLIPTLTIKAQTKAVNSSNNKRMAVFVLEGLCMERDLVKIIGLYKDIKNNVDYRLPGIGFAEDGCDVDFYLESFFKDDYNIIRKLTKNSDTIF